MKREFKTEYLADLLDRDQQEAYTYIDTSKGTEIYEMVFRFDGKLWQVDHYPGFGWDWDDDRAETVEADEVEAYEVTETRYRKTAS